MARRSGALLLLILILTTPLAGCWSRVEIESGGFADLVAIDKGENGQVELTFSMAITESLAGSDGGGGGGDVPAWTVTASGNSLAEAIASSRTFSSRLPFWFHAQALIIGEDLAKDGIAPMLDYALRTRDFRLTTPVFVAEGKAKDVLQLSPKITKLPGRYIRDLLSTSRENSTAREERLLDVIEKLIAGPGEEFFLPLIRPKPKEANEGEKGEAGGGGESGQGGGKPEEKPEALVLEGTAVFVDDKLVGKLNGTETRGMLWLRGETQRATVMVRMENGVVAQQQIYARRTLRVEREGDQLRVAIGVFQDGDVLEYSIPEDIELNAFTLSEMDAALTATIQSEVEAALRKLQQDLRADTLGIGRRVYHLYPELFNSLDWRQVFPDIPVEVTVQANFRRTGESAQSRLVR